MKNLTQRQLEILALLIGGATQADAARELGLAQQTVSQHMEGARTEMKCGTMFQLAFRLGCLMRQTVKKEEA